MTYNQLEINLDHDDLETDFDQCCDRDLTYPFIPFQIKRAWFSTKLDASFRDEADGSGGVVTPIKSFLHAVFWLLLFMCFGKKLEDDVVLKIETVLHDLTLRYPLSNLLSIFPRITKILFPRPCGELLELRRRREEVILRLIRDCRAAGRKPTISSIDSLLSLELPDGRKLEDKEILVLCAEFLNGGNATTSTTPQWVMANLVKNPGIQAKLHEEVSSVVGERAEVNEDDLTWMPYLKAVAMETLRRHPPSHLMLNHTAMDEDETLGGHAIPVKALINFMAREMGLEEKVWKEPLEFRPERFLPGGEGEEVDITRSKKKMSLWCRKKDLPWQ
ncbi:cytochrome P450 89A2-like [Nymphaea colorata]|nr:cytochrome P450 89A2-like [Nymphaea colorata]